MPPKSRIDMRGLNDAQRAILSKLLDGTGLTKADLAKTTRVVKKVVEHDKNTAYSNQVLKAYVNYEMALNPGKTRMEIIKKTVAKFKGDNRKAVKEVLGLTQKKEEPELNPFPEPDAGSLEARQLEIRRDVAAEQAERKPKVQSKSLEGALDKLLLDEGAAKKRTQEGISRGTFGDLSDSLFDKSSQLYRDNKETAKKVMGALTKKKINDGSWLTEIASLEAPEIAVFQQLVNMTPAAFTEKDKADFAKLLSTDPDVRASLDDGDADMTLILKLLVNPDQMGVLVRTRGQQIAGQAKKDLNNWVRKVEGLDPERDFTKDELSAKDVLAKRRDIRIEEEKQELKGKNRQLALDILKGKKERPALDPRLGKYADDKNIAPVSQNQTIGNIGGGNGLKAGGVVLRNTDIPVINDDSKIVEPVRQPFGGLHNDVVRVGGRDDIPLLGDDGHITKKDDVPTGEGGLRSGVNVLKNPDNVYEIGTPRVDAETEFGNILTPPPIPGYKPSSATEDVIDTMADFIRGTSTKNNSQGQYLNRLKVSNPAAYNQYKADLQAYETKVKKIRLGGSSKIIEGNFNTLEETFNLNEKLLQQGVGEMSDRDIDRVYDLNQLLMSAKNKQTDMTYSQYNKLQREIMKKIPASVKESNQADITKYHDSLKTAFGENFEGDSNLFDEAIFGLKDGKPIIPESKDLPQGKISESQIQTEGNSQFPHLRPQMEWGGTDELLEITEEEDARADLIAENMSVVPSGWGNGNDNVLFKANLKTDRMRYSKTYPMPPAPKVESGILPPAFQKEMRGVWTPVIPPPLRSMEDSMRQEDKYGQYKKWSDDVVETASPWKNIVENPNDFPHYADIFTQGQEQRVDGKGFNFQENMRWMR